MAEDRLIFHYTGYTILDCLCAPEIGLDLGIDFGQIVALGARASAFMLYRLA